MVPPEYQRARDDFYNFLIDARDTAGLSPNPTLFRSCLGDEPYSRGQWDTALRATPQSPKGDVSCGQCLRAPCTLKCPRLPVSPPSLIASAAQVCRIRVSSTH